MTCVVAIALAVVVWGPWRHPADVRDGTRLVDVEGMSAAHGIYIDLLAVVAAGGLVELRMQVTDPDKADDVMHSDDELPILVDEASGATLVMSSPPHHRDELELGGQYFFLLANAGSALRDGSLVTIVVGDTRLEHVEVVG